MVFVVLLLWGQHIFLAHLVECAVSPPDAYPSQFKSAVVMRAV